MITITLDKEHAYVLEMMLRKLLEASEASEAGRREMRIPEGREVTLTREIFNSLSEELAING